jgi:hypothetical protein
MSQGIFIHPQQCEALKAALAKALPAVAITNNMFIEPFTAALLMYSVDQKLEKHGKLKQALEAILGEGPILNFVGDQIAIILKEKDDYQASPKYKTLLQAMGDDFCNSMPGQIVDLLKSLPWEYMISLELPEKLSTELLTFIKSDIDLGGLRLSTDVVRLSNDLPISNLNDALNTRLYSGDGIFSQFIQGGENSTRQWKDGRVFLQASVSGYIDVYGTSKTARSFESTLKSFLGMSFALRVLTYSRSYSLHGSKVFVLVHRLSEDGAAQPIHRYSLSERLGSSLGDWSAYYTKFTDEAKQASAIGWAISRIPLMAPLFLNPAKHQRLLTASAWLFDSITNDDSLLGFVQAMIVLEILLGDDVPSGEMTLGALLRNRCAYLISESMDEREKITESLKKIYEVRSKIVHRGKSELSTVERGMLEELRSLCCRVIIAEFNLSLGLKR